MKLLRRRERETGAAAVEFALVAPVMIALMFGIVEFGVAFNYKTTVNNYAAVTARSPLTSIMMVRGSSQCIFTDRPFKLRIISAISS